MLIKSQILKHQDSLPYQIIAFYNIAEYILFELQVVGSMDGFLYRYLAEIRLQTNESEVIQDLTDIVRKLLISFYIATQYKPTKIIYYRTGVCESQFSWVCLPKNWK